jgi:hypothetical protein
MQGIASILRDTSLVKRADDSNAEGGAWARVEQGMTGHG